MKPILIGILFSLILFPNISFAQTTSTLSPDALAKLILNLQAQLASLQAQLQSQVSTATTTEGGWKFDYSKAKLKLGIDKEVEYDDDDIVNLFLVMNNRLYEDKKWTKDKTTDDYRIWNIFAAIAGDDFVDQNIDKYATYRFADTGVLGFVQIVDNDDPEWGLAINANASNFSSEKWVRDVVAVLIHEYTHILTLNKKEVERKVKSLKFCKERYMTSIGCAKQDSYLNVFVDKFWTEEDLEYTGSYTSYYRKHEDDFITKYAPKSPEEDIAESFAQFILYGKPTGTKKKDLKVLFFYEYPELIEMRNRIRGEVEEYFNT